MIRLTLILMFLVVAVSTLVSYAQDRRARGDDRYMVSEVEGGILRVDRQTGAVSMCERHRGDWTCELVPDDRDAMLREITDLRNENRALRRRLADYDPDAANRGYGFRQPPGGPPAEDENITKKDVDEAIDTFEYMMDRLMGTAEKLRPPPR